jgi:hypothetical protein
LNTKAVTAIVDGEVIAMEKILRPLWLLAMDSVIG